MSTMAMDSFRCISVLGRGHFGKVRFYVEINFVPFSLYQALRDTLYQTFSKLLKSLSQFFFVKVAALHAVTLQEIDCTHRSFSVHFQKFSWQIFFGILTNGIVLERKELKCFSQFYIMFDNFVFLFFVFI